MRSIILSVVFLLSLTVVSFGGVYIVNDTTDGHSINQLRGALEAVEKEGTTGHTILIYPGIYNLRLGQISFGSIPLLIEFIGWGPDSTIINMTGTNPDRIFDINPTGTTPNVHIMMRGITFRGGRVTRINSGGGGAIHWNGLPGSSLFIIDCLFENNSSNITSRANGGAIVLEGGGQCVIDHCRFINNSTVNGVGGALFYYSFSPPGSLQISNCVFDINSANGRGRSGGAIAVDVIHTEEPLQTSNVYIEQNSFTNNHADDVDGHGGAISIRNDFAVGNTVHINYNRFYRNSAFDISDNIAMFRSIGNVNIEHNWWGCNLTPFTGNCMMAFHVGALDLPGRLQDNTWLQLRVKSADPEICSGNTANTTTVTAHFLIDNMGNPVDSTRLGALEGVEVTFTSIPNTLSNAQATIQSDGTATATFTSNGFPGNIEVQAQADDVPTGDAEAHTAITVNASPNIIIQPAGRAVCPGNEAIFTVTATGEALNYNWLRGGIKLSDGETTSGSIIAGSITNALSVQNTGPDDIGSNYSVRIIDSNGCTTFSDNTTLIVGTLSLQNESGIIIEHVKPTDYAMNDGGCQRYALVKPEGSDPVSGQVTINLTVAGDQPAYNGQPYVKRYYNITPTNNPDNATALVTLYFLQSEFDSYNDARPGKENDLPVGPLDTKGIENLRITQYHGVGTTPGTYTYKGTNPAVELLKPSSVVWNSANNWWEVSFDVKGFSGFFVTGLINSALPVTLQRITASPTQNGNLVEWQVTNEVNFLHYEVEHSGDGNNFAKLSIVPATQSNLYRYLHRNPGAVTNYYRLKMVDIDGNYSYSRTVSCAAGDLVNALSILRNPFVDNLQLKLEVNEDMEANIEIADLAGRLLLRKKINVRKGSNIISLPETSSLLKGIYLVRLNSNGFNKTIKVVKAER